MKGLVLAILLVAPPAIVATPAAAASESGSPAAKQAASELARMVAPKVIMIPLNMKWAEKSIEELPKLNEDSGALEAEFPGIHNAMWMAAKDEMRSQLEVDLPRLWSRLEQLYLTEMTEQEIRGLISFYATPTGQRLIAAMYGDSDLQPMIKSVATSEDGSVSEQAFQAVTEDAKQKALANADIDPQDLVPLMSAMPLAKMRAVGEKVQQTTREWVNEDNPEQQERINKLMVDAAERFVKASKTPSK